MTGCRTWISIASGLSRGSRKRALRAVVLAVVGLSLYSCRSKDPGREMAPGPVDSVVPAVVDPPDRTGPSDSLLSRGGVDAALGTYSLDSLRLDSILLDTSAVTIVDRKCALYLDPDSAATEEERAQMSEEAYLESMDDYQYYTYTVASTLESRGLLVEALGRRKRYVRFQYPDGSGYTIDLARGRDLRGLVLFDRAIAPVLWLGTELSPEWDRRLSGP